MRKYASFLDWSDLIMRGGPIDTLGPLVKPELTWSTILRSIIPSASQPESSSVIDAQLQNCWNKKLGFHALRRTTFSMPMCAFGKQYLNV